MNDTRRILLSAALTATSLAVLGGGVAQASNGSAKITARPHNAMVDTTASLKGKGFPANTMLHLRECGTTFWLAPVNPCLEGDVSVMTDRKGKFQTSFQVGLCPEGASTRKPTQRVCYVGEILTGEDTGSLVGAARLVVTYP